MLPHIWVSIIILVFAFISLGISLYYYKSNELIFSISSNIFAGLVTGLVISLISFIKGMSLYITQNKIQWLNQIHQQCIEFMKESRKLYLSKERDFKSDEEKYDKIYNLLCIGNNISLNISQGQFNETCPFNTYKFCKKKLNFDSLQQENINGDLREKIINMDVSQFGNKEIKNLFQDMEKAIFSLNASIVNKIRQLEIKNKAINVT